MTTRKVRSTRRRDRTERARLETFIDGPFDRVASLALDALLVREESRRLRPKDTLEESRA